MREYVWYLPFTDELIVLYFEPNSKPVAWIRAETKYKLEYVGEL